MPVLVLSYKPQSIHTPHPCRIASMAESALDGSALGRVRGVTPPVFIVTADSRDASKSQPRVLSRQDAERELRTAKSLKTRPSRNRILTRFPCGVKTSINHPPQRLSTKKAAPRGAAFACSFLLIVTQKLFQHIHRRAANRIFLSGIEKIAYLDFRPNAHGAIVYIARMF